MPEKKLKLELELNKPVKIELLQDQCLTGTSRYGEYYLYNVRNGTGEELTFFPDKEVHEKLKDLRRGDKVEICKRAEQRGSKVVTTFEVKVLPNNVESPEKVNNKILDDNYFNLMLTSCRDAVRIQNELGGLMDAKSLAVTLFIARSKITPNGYN
ncbi:MAG: hypothetical protein IPM56_04380 [Ignavibacteriales bacterium]|nr:MAG: hypothetical protein IPM56_04380 [Ignavibacteriales bacterium]